MLEYIENLSKDIENAKKSIEALVWDKNHHAEDCRILLITYEDKIKIPQNITYDKEGLRIIVSLMEKHRSEFIDRVEYNKYEERIKVLEEKIEDYKEKSDIYKDSITAYKEKCEKCEKCDKLNYVFSNMPNINFNLSNSNTIEVKIDIQQVVYNVKKAINNSGLKNKEELLEFVSELNRVNESNEDVQSKKEKTFKILGTIIQTGTKAAELLLPLATAIISNQS